MRIADGMLSIPVFFLVLVVLTSLGSTLPNLIVTIGLSSWMTTARVVRGEILRASALEFVPAARALGASGPRVLLRHALPQALPVTIVSASLGVAQAVLTESALSYLGPRRPAADAVVGQHALGRPELRLHGADAGPLAGPGDPADGAVVQLPGRIAARPARPVQPPPIATRSLSGRGQR